MFFQWESKAQQGHFLIVLSESPKPEPTSPEFSIGKGQRLRMGDFHPDSQSLVGRDRVCSCLHPRHLVPGNGGDLVNACEMKEQVN